MINKDLEIKINVFKGKSKSNATHIFNRFNNMCANGEPLEVFDGEFKCVVKDVKWGEPGNGLFTVTVTLLFTIDEAVFREWRITPNGCFLTFPNWGGKVLEATITTDSVCDVKVKPDVSVTRACFKYIGDAIASMQKIHDTIQKNGFITLNTFYKLCDIESDDSKDFRYGWKNDAHVTMKALDDDVDAYEIMFDAPVCKLGADRHKDYMDAFSYTAEIFYKGLINDMYGDKSKSIRFVPVVFNDFSKAFKCMDLINKSLLQNKKLSMYQYYYICTDNRIAPSSYPADYWWVSDAFARVEGVITTNGVKYQVLFNKEPVKINGRGK